jgi:hypothetical protein
MHAMRLVFTTFLSVRVWADGKLPEIPTVSPHHLPLLPHIDGYLTRMLLRRQQVVFILE